MERKFKDLYLAGEVEFEAIDDYSYEWGMSDEECTLAQYLGLNEEEEDAWVSDSEDALKEPVSYTHLTLPTTPYV